MGLTDTPPDLKAVREGVSANQVGAEATTLILWTRFFGVREGDVLTLRLLGPEGEIVNNSTTMTKNRAEEMRYAGKRSAKPWPKGRYEASASINRDGRRYEVMEKAFQLN